MTRACFCIGPQNGAPLCPCQMRSRTDQDRELADLREENRKLRDLVGRGGPRPSLRDRLRASY